MATSFGSLYDYQLKNGIVLPQVSSVRAKVEDAFLELFGADFSLEPETPQGRLVEAIALLFADILRVNALNANSFNLNQAVGAYLDNLGAVYGVARQADEGDTAYRKRILASASRGSGYASSLRNAIGDVIADASAGGTIGASNVVVLDNGMEDPQLMPKAEDGSVYPHSIPVAAHSVFISVLSDGAEGEDAKIAAAIRSAKSAGCGYTTSADGGTLTTVYLAESGEEAAGASVGTFTARFFRPARRSVKVQVTVIDSAYTGSDVKADTAAAVKELLDSRHMNDTITKSEVAAAIASVGKGIVCTAVTLLLADVDEPDAATTWAEADRLVIPAFRYVAVSLDDITVSVNNTL